jgi:hypothetical protein
MSLLTLPLIPIFTQLAFPVISTQLPRYVKLFPKKQIFSVGDCSSAGDVFLHPITMMKNKIKRGKYVFIF